MIPVAKKQCKHDRIIYRLVSYGLEYETQYVCCGCNKVMDVKEKEYDYE